MPRLGARLGRISQSGKGMSEGVLVPLIKCHSKSLILYGIGDPYKEKGSH